MISPGSAGGTCKFTINMKPMRILHKKTQRFLRGRLVEEGVYINKEQRWGKGFQATKQHCSQTYAFIKGNLVAKLPTY